MKPPEKEVSKGAWKRSVFEWLNQTCSGFYVSEEKLLSRVKSGFEKGRVKGVCLYNWIKLPVIQRTENQVPYI